MNLNRITKHLRVSNVIAFLALFVALSAGAAADLPGIGVINSGDIKNNTVRGKDVRDGSIVSSDVRNSSLLARDFKPGELPAGPRGPQGLPGARGATGPAGPVNLVYRKGTSPLIAVGATSGFAVSCPASAPHVVGGGYDAAPVTENIRLVTSHPTDGVDADAIPDDNWLVEVHNAGTKPVLMTTYAICTAATEVAQAPDEL
jgi:hypothetical protein